MKLIFTICLMFLPITGYSDYIRTGPVESDQGWTFIIGVMDWQEVDSWEQGGKRYRFQTRYDDREIVEVVNNGTMCYSNTVRGNLYFKNKKLKFTEEIRFKCRYVR